MFIDYRSWRPEMIVYYSSAFLLTLIFSGFFFLDKSFHRVLMYVFLLINFFYYFRFKPDFSYLNNGGLRSLIYISVAYLVFNSVSILWSGGLSLDDVFQNIKIPIFICAFTIFLSFYVHLNPKILDYIFGGFLISGFLVGLFLLCFHFLPEIYQNPSLDNLKNFRLRGIGLSKNSIIIAQLYGVCCLVASFYKPYNDKLASFVTPLMRVVLGGFCLFLMLITGSRGPMLAILATACVVSFLYAPKRTVTLVLVGGVIVGLLFPYLSEFIDFNRPSYRLEIWQQAWGYFQAKPVLGYGIIGDLKYHLSAERHNVQNNPHNILIGSAVIGGAVGLALVCAFIFLIFMKAYQLISCPSGLLVFSIIVFGLFCMQTAGHTYFVNLNREWLFVWVPLALILGLFPQKNQSLKPSPR